MTASNTEVLLKGFLDKLPSRASESIADKMKRWADVANHPERYITDGDTSRHAIQARRKVAVQSLRRLIARNPAVAQQLHAERDSQGAQQ